ncbi:MAG: crossover junction endodeoxyribonuclease RuvC [Myxococcota bacterium]
MRVVGIDPGTLKLGWGVVERRGTRLRHVAHGTLRLKPGPLARRLVQIDRELTAVLETHRPQQGAVESRLFAKNAQRAAKRGPAPGVVRMGLSRAGLEVGEYPPAQVKRAVVGRGGAAKAQVAHIMAAMLTLGEPPQEDAADALAVAVTHLNSMQFQAAVTRAALR